MFVFKKKNCILHHIAFLVWLQLVFFQPPITHFQPLKTHFLTVILPFSAMCFMDRKGFLYTIAVYFYAFRLAFSTILPCVLHQNALHLASKRTAFCAILHCIQPHIARYFAENSPKIGVNGVPLEQIFILHHSQTNPILHQNKPSRESIFCGKWAIGGRKRHSEC